MPRRPNIKGKQPANQNLSEKIRQLEELNASVKEEKKKELTRLEKAKKSRLLFAAITVLSIFFFFNNLSKLDKQYNFLMKASYIDIANFIIVHVKKSMQTLSIQFTAVIVLFNLIASIVSQLNFPLPKPLFYSQLCQGLLGLASAFIPECFTFIFFLLTSWTVSGC